MKDYIQELEEELNKLGNNYPKSELKYQCLQYMIERLKRDFDFEEYKGPLYICDSEKNTECKGRGSWVCGTECMNTIYWKYAKH